MARRPVTIRFVSTRGDSFDFSHLLHFKIACIEDAGWDRRVEQILTLIIMQSYQYGLAKISSLIDDVAESGRISLVLGRQHVLPEENDWSMANIRSISTIDLHVGSLLWKSIFGAFLYLITHFSFVVCCPSGLRYSRGPMSVAEEVEGRENDEKRLLRHLMRGYERDVRPVKNASTPVVIQLSITLTQIFDMVT